MKRKAILILGLLAIYFSFGYGQFSFGVSSGIGLNSAYFGYKVNSKLVPYVGLQYLNAGFMYRETTSRYDLTSGDLISTYGDTLNISGGLYFPNVGIKYFIKQQNKLQAYVSLNLSRPLISGKLTIYGEEDESIKEFIKKISMFGSELGFGVEYFFDENFSLGGEFGIRYIYINYADTSSRQTSISEYNYENILKFTTSPTFSKISLNFYF